MQFSSAPLNAATLASNTDMQTMLTRLSAARALNLDNLDELVSLAEQRKAIAGGPGMVGSPDGAWVQPITSAVAWTYGAWAQVQAAIGSALIYVGVSVSRQAPAGAVSATELQLGVGAGGSEIVQLTVSIPAQQAATDAAPVWVPFMLPVKVPNGARTAVRVKQNLASASTYNVQFTAIDPANTEKWSA